MTANRIAVKNGRESKAQPTIPINANVKNVARLPLKSAIVPKIGQMNNDKSATIDDTAPQMVVASPVESLPTRELK